MSQSKLEKIKKLVQQERASCKNINKPTYSPFLRKEIALLAKTISITKLSNELGVARSFIFNMKKKHQAKDINPSKKQNEIPEVQLLEIPNFMKEEKRSNPIIKLNMSNVLHIEIFN